jgi:hypothetical protein
MTPTTCIQRSGRSHPRNVVALVWLCLAVLLGTQSRTVAAQSNVTTGHTATSVTGYGGAPALAPMGIAIPVIIGQGFTYSADHADAKVLAKLAPAYAYIADTGNNRIGAITTTGGQTSVIIAGSSSSASGTAGGDALTTARFNRPNGVVALLPSGADGTKKPTLYVTDTNNHCIRKIDQTVSIVSSFAGLCGTSGNVPASSSSTSAHSTTRFNGPVHLTVATATPGAIIVSDTGNRCIRRLSLDASNLRTATIAGTCGSASPATLTDGDALTTAKLDSPWGIVAVRGGATVYFTERNRGLLRKLSNGIVSTVIASGTGINPTLGLAFLRPLAQELNNPDALGTLVIAGTTSPSGDAPTGGLLEYDERTDQSWVFAALNVAQQAAALEAFGAAAYVAADNSDSGLQPKSVSIACCPRGPIATAAPTAAPTPAPPTRTRTVPPPRTQTKSLRAFAKPAAVTSTIAISASVIANVNSPAAQRQIEIHLLNAEWNLTWCAPVNLPVVQFRSTTSSLNEQPCGVLRNAQRSIILESIQCSKTRMYLTFLPYRRFALINNLDENLLYSFNGSYLILPDGAEERGILPELPMLPITFVADQGNVTCNPNATDPPAPTNATLAPEVYRIEWPSEVEPFLWTSWRPSPAWRASVLPPRQAPRTSFGCTA